MCPIGTTPCSQNTNVDNTVCYPPDEHNLCPITEIKIIRTSEDYNYPNEMYTKQWLVENETIFMYSKVTDGRPIIQTRVETQPCLYPEETSIDEDQAWYPLEYRASGCTEYEDKGDIDQRYTIIGMPQVSQLDIQGASGVIFRLIALPLYEEKYFPANSYESVKRATMYDFWVRPAIEW